MEWYMADRRQARAMVVPSEDVLEVVVLSGSPQVMPGERVDPQRDAIRNIAGSAP